MYVSYDDGSQKMWPCVWDGMSKTLLQPGLLKYFEKSIGATEWNGHLLAPVLVFGNLDTIDHDEYEKAMQALVHFLECFAKHIDNTNDLHSFTCLVADIHCCTRDVYALILAQLFASLYKIFEKSRTAANFVYDRYRAYLIKAIQYPESYDFTFVGASRHQDKKSYDQLIVSLDLQIGDETRCCHDLIDSVAIGIMAERYLLQKQDTIPEGWVSELPLWQPIHLNESMYMHDIVVRFLVDSLHCVAPSAFSEDNTTAGYFLSNFVVHVEGIPFAVHDWLIAPVFPYFALALCAGMSEALTKEMHIPAPFFADIMRCIILRGYGFMSQAICAGFAIEIGPLSLPDHGVFNQLNEFGVSINLLKRFNLFSESYKSYIKFVRGGVYPTTEEIAACAETAYLDTCDPPVQTRKIVEQNGSHTVTRILWAPQPAKTCNMSPVQNRTPLRTKSLAFATESLSYSFHFNHDLGM